MMIRMRKWKTWGWWWKWWLGWVNEKYEDGDENDIFIFHGRKTRGWWWKWWGWVCGGDCVEGYGNGYSVKEWL